MSDNDNVEYKYEGNEHSSKGLIINKFTSDLGNWDKNENIDVSNTSFEQWLKINNQIPD